MVSATRASSKLSFFVSTSAFGRIPPRESSVARSNSDLARLYEACADSTRRSTSVSSSGVGSGAISKRGSRDFTVSPTSARQRFTMPEIFDFTWNFWRGWTWPTASAFSVMDPVSAATSFQPLADFLPPCVNA